MEHDIVLGTESWLCTDIFENEIFPDSHIVYRNDRCKGRGGGVFALISRDIKSEVIFHSNDFKEKISDSESIWIKLKSNAGTIVLAVVYNPSGKLDFIDDITTIAKMIRGNNANLPLNGSEEIIMGGDFNLNSIYHISWHDNQIIGDNISAIVFSFH